MYISCTPPHVYIGSGEPALALSPTLGGHILGRATHHPGASPHNDSVPVLGHSRVSRPTLPLPGPRPL